ncbi:hypothetical protein Leryth_001600 [Lithospermum erythrorhizon]|nr:hypothetical protein Leryth_001600 [Lithospermum erythrorhizon]
MADPNIVQLEHTSINEEIQIVSRNSSPTQTYSTSSPQANNNQEPPTGSSPQAHNQEPPAAQVVVDIDDEDGNETTNITNDGEVVVDIDEDDNEPTNTTPDDEEDEIETTNENSCILLHGQRKAVNTFLESREEIVRTRIGFNGETAFHMAVLSAKEKNVAHVVKKILKIMETEFLAIGNSFGTNALHYAAASGNWEITKLIHLKNPGLANAFNNHNLKPIFLAATAGHSDVIKFLLGVTTLFAEDDHHASSVLKYCIKASLFDIAVDIVQNRCPRAATWDNGGDENTQTALEVLAEMPSSDDHKHCSSVKKLLDAIWPILKESDLYKTSYLENLLLTSAKKGNHEFIVYLLRHYPGLINTMDSSRHTIFHIAIVHRHEKIFTLIHEIGSLKDYIATYQDINNDSMLHLAAKLSPPNQLNRVHGAALQMQRELLWYKVSYPNIQIMPL